MLCIFMLNCTEDAGVLVLYNIHMHPNSVFSQRVRNGSALAELLHCAVQSGRAPMQRAPCRFSLWKAVTLTAPRGTGREMRSSSWWPGLKRASETVWVSPLAKSILETISSQQSIFTWLYLLFYEVVFGLVRQTRLREERNPLPANCRRSL